MQLIDPRAAEIEEWRPGVRTRMVTSARNGAVALCIFEQWIDPGAGAPTHRHSVEEVLTVREGEAEVWLDDGRMRLSIGQSVIVPAGRRHGFRNVGAATLHMHAVLASAIFEMFPDGAGELTRRWTD